MGSLRAGKSKCETWEEMKTAMEERFILPFLDDDDLPNASDPPAPSHAPSSQYLQSHLLPYSCTQDTWNKLILCHLTEEAESDQEGGENGTIDGQGSVWWNMWRRGSLKFTKPNLLELMHSKNAIISNVVFCNSPFWNIHPVYFSNVVIRYSTILAPYDSPNTDGINPDCSSNVCIEDCYIATGDDMVVVKSGWEEYDIAYGHSSSGLTIRRLSGTSPFAGIAIGSETSGGVQNVLVEPVTLFNSGISIHLKTNIDRGGIIRNITVSNVYISDEQMGIKIVGAVGYHPDNKFNPNALPKVSGIILRNIWWTNVQQPGSIIL